MRRFLAFAHAHFYPCGGWEDYVGSADTKEDALQLVRDKTKSEWDDSYCEGHVVDTELGEIVEVVEFE